MHQKSSRLLFFMCALFSAPVAYAENTDHFADYPAVSGELILELEGEASLGSDDPEDERDISAFNAEISAELGLSENFYIDTTLVLEPVRDPDPGKDSFFEDEGAYVEELTLNFEYGPWSAFAGKFNPGFDTSWERDRGIWTEDFAEDYEITEKIGLGGAYEMESDRFGNHIASASAFFADTTFLSGSLGTSREHVSLEDGGLSNTESLSSYVVTLEGAEIPPIETIYYRLGYRHLEAAKEDEGDDDEGGVILRLGNDFAIDVTEHFTADLLTEYTYVEDFEGTDDNNHYFTVSLVNTFYDRLNLAIGFTARKVDSREEPTAHDHLLQVSGGYDFGTGLTAEIGWRNTEEDGVHTDIAGGIVRYTYDF
ncbi:MAG: DUF481 domain-containing protein [Alphaproteobacteria bacterium]|nr:DUF481 domain-containing protein [Alphaproteobacteria bacterium]